MKGEDEFFTSDDAGASIESYVERLRRRAGI